jgi:TonB family protein
MCPSGGIEVYSARELAGAVGVSLDRIEALMATGELPSIDGRFVTHGTAVAWGRRLRQGHGAAGAALTLPLANPMIANALAPPDAMFEMRSSAPREAGLPAAISAAAHLLVGVFAILLTTAGLNSEAARTEERVSDPVRLVFLSLPGPGGGGGGGGLKQRIPPPAAKRQGQRSLSSPVPPREPPPPVEPPKADPPPPPPQEELPPVVAPVATVASDEKDQTGVLEKTEAKEESRGPGENGGVGAGRGTGVGEGEGSGIGPGSGGGIGGGPYRPGSGIEPPALLREVKPIYTDEARRRNVTGDVVLEIVVRSDGRVGDVRILEGIGSGLDQRAVDAVRQWRFSPARRLGQPVDVLVEVAVEFRLR